MYLSIKSRYLVQLLKYFLQKYHNKKIYIQTNKKTSLSAIFNVSKLYEQQFSNLSSDFCLIVRHYCPLQ